MEGGFWKNKRVLITGNTGFKGSWLSLWLLKLGAEVHGYSLEPITDPSLFDLCCLNNDIRTVTGDIRDDVKLTKSVKEINPEIIIHMAAQAIVRQSYSRPVDTYSVNVMGTVNILEAARKTERVRAVINVTTDKCYENREWCWGYRENDALGGYDPYSSSKACSELVTAAYRNSFLKDHKIGVATARAGNVIGGGDWAEDRLIPDFIRALLKNEKIKLRNPCAIRPWQHVLEPLFGYMLLAQKLYEKSDTYSEAWNFGPDAIDAKTVEWVIKKLYSLWGSNAEIEYENGFLPHEANFLKLDCSKAVNKLGWQPKWNMDKTLEKVVEWLRAYVNNADLRSICFEQIHEYESTFIEVKND